MAGCFPADYDNYLAWHNRLTPVSGLQETKTRWSSIEFGKGGSRLEY
jgi:hypothetical protein